MMKLKIAALTIFLSTLILSSNFVHGTTITYTNRADFEKSILQISTINFNDIYMRPLPRGYSIEDLTFNSTGGLYSTYWTNGSYAIASENGPPITISLNPGIRAIGMDVSFLLDRESAFGQYALYGKSGILSSGKNISIPKSGTFIGWTSNDEDILNLELYVSVPFISAFPAIDNVSYGNPTAAPVPEPASIALLSAGLLCLATFTRKIKKLYKFR